MHPLEQRFDAEENGYRHLRKSCESKVVRWEHWDNFYWHWDPVEQMTYQDEWWKEHPPKRTSKDKALYSYGYDASGRVVVIHSALPGKELSETTQEFIRYSGTVLTSSTFYGDSLLEVSAANMVGTRTIRVENVGGRSGSGWYTIEWSGDHVSRMLFGDLGEPPCQEERYSKTGKLIDRYDLPRKLRLPKGVNVQALARTIREHLMRVVPKIVAKAGIKQPVYCLTLAYDGEGNGVVPPSLAIGLDSARKKWIRTKGKAAKEFIWNPAEFRIYETEKTVLPTDKKFEQACDWYNQLLEKKGSDKPAHDLLNRIAADLAKLNWRGKLNTTEDFIVFAVDYEGADLKKNVKASVAPKLLAKFKAADRM